MTAIAQRLAEVRVAMMLLTRLPMGRMSGPVPTLAQAGWAFPLAGAVVGGIGWAAFALAVGLGLPPAVCAVLAVVAGVLVTGGLHEDGLADLADGLGGGRDRAGKLEIMRDSRIGSYGVLALGLVILLKVQAIAALPNVPALVWAFVAFAAVSRAAMLAAMAALPPARPDGLGRMAGLDGGWRLPAGLGAALVLSLPMVAAFGAPALAILILAALVGAIPAWLANRQLGGQTGDVLGAVQQVAEAAGWVALTALL